MTGLAANTLTMTRVYTLLIVNPDRYARQLLADMLRGEGYAIVETASADEGLAVLADGGCPDLVLINGPDGPRLCRQFKMLACGTTLPVMVITDGDDDQIIMECFGAGANDVLLTPLRTALLQHKIRALLSLTDQTVALRRREERYRIVTEMAADFAYEATISADGRMVLDWMTDGITLMTDYTLDELRDDGWRWLMHPEDLAIAEQRFAVLLSGQPDMSEFRIVGKNGQVRWINDRAYPTWDAVERRVVRIHGVGRDITRRKQVEQALFESRERLQLALDAADDGLWDWDMITHQTYFSPRWFTMLGYAEGELPSTFETWRDLIHPDDLEAVLQCLQAHIDHGASYEVEHRLRTRSGEWKWIKARGKVVARSLDGEPLRMAGTHEDIDQRKMMESALAHSEERYRIISNMISDYAYSYIVNPDGTLVKDWSTQAFHDITGFSREEMINGGWDTLIHPDDHAVSQQRYHRLISGEDDVSEFRIVTKWGEIRWLLDHGHPVYSAEAGRVTRIYGAAQDITWRKRNEDMLRQQAEELRTRNEELDAFAYTVAHDLKNPIASMMGFASLIQNYYDRMTDDKIKEYLALIVEGGYKLKEIINALLLLAGVSKMDRVEMSSLDMLSIVEQAKARLYAMIEESQASLSIPAQWPVVAGYGPWVEEVWANYISNAVKYGGKPPTIELGADALPDGMVRFWVRDNGRGLTDDEQRRVFTPFTRLNQVKIEGHGLGLSVVQRIVSRLGGQVAVESIVGQGSVFSFTLPSANGSA
jgi:PAS domain S-box-containing protein